MSVNVTIKTVYEGDVRRLTFDSEALTFDALRSTVAEQFAAALGARSFALKYNDDDDDVITIASDAELREALACTATGALRVRVHALDAAAPAAATITATAATTTTTPAVEQAAPAAGGVAAADNGDDAAAAAVKVAQDGADAANQLFTNMMQWFQTQAATTSSTTAAAAAVAAADDAAANGDAPPAVAAPSAGDLATFLGDMAKSLQEQSAAAAERATAAAEVALTHAQVAATDANAAVAEASDNEHVVRANALVGATVSDAERRLAEVLAACDALVRNGIVGDATVIYDALARSPAQLQQLFVTLARRVVDGMQHAADTATAAMGGAGATAAVDSSAKGKLFARYVRDVTLDDGAAVSAGEQLTKRWAVRNSGANAWPAGVRLVHVGGDALGTATGEPLATETQPGAEVELSAQLSMPSEAGRYVAYYRLASPSGHAFGHRLWADVNVTAPAAAANDDGVEVQQGEPSDSIIAEVNAFTALHAANDTADATAAAAPAAATVEATANTTTTAAAAAAADTDDAKFATEKATLNSMGFSNNETDLDALLTSHNGNVVAVVQELISQERLVK